MPRGGQSIGLAAAGRSLARPMGDRNGCAIHGGATSRALELGGIWVAEARYAPHQAIPPHSHETFQVCSVLQGAYEESSGRTTVACSRDTTLMRAPGRLHSSMFTRAGGRCLLVRVDGSLLRGHSWAGFAPSELRLSRQGSPSWLARKICHELEADAAIAVLAIHGLALALVAELARTPSLVTPETRPLRWLESVRSRIERQFAGPLMLDDLAGVGGVHKDHLTRAFRHQYGQTPREYHRQCRVEDACERLTATNESLRSIAHATGFADQSHFTRTFRSAIGATPLVYRRACREQARAASADDTNVGRVPSSGNRTRQSVPHVG